MGSICSCDVGNKYCLYSFGEKSLRKGSFGRLLKIKNNDDKMYLRKCSQL
jgi:hypothetical protein